MIESDKINKLSNILLCFLSVHYLQMDTVCKNRLKNEFVYLINTPLKGILIEGHDVSNRFLKLIIKNRKVSFEFPRNYPFEPPVITDEAGLNISVKEGMIYSLIEIVKEVEKFSLSSVFDFEDDPDVVKINQKKEKELQTSQPFQPSCIG